jgi:alpha-L-fucosidase
MKIGFYYSQNLDWSHAGGGHGGGKHWDPAHSDGDRDKYVDGQVIPQLRELLTNYGPIDILWFDIPGGAINKPRADRIMAAVLACNPKILINNRLGGGYHGDTETPEQFVPATGFPGRDWETCMTMNNTWGFKKRDNHWKSATSIIRMFSDIASKGGNFLLNVGPSELGEIPAPSLERMKEIGAWSAANAAALYGTEASPFPRAFPWGRVTRRDNTIYLHVFDLPADRRLTLAGLTTPVKSAKMLVGGASLEIGDKNGAPVVVVPEGVKFDSAVTVIEVTLDGKPIVVAPVAPLQAPDAKGAYELKADDAVLTGALQVTKAPVSGGFKGSNDAITHWTKAADTVSWRCRIDRPGAYTVKIEYACEAASAGSEVRIAADGSLSADGKFIGGTFVVKSTGSFDKYVVSDALALDIAKTGPVVLELKAVKKPGHAVMNVRRVTLEPKP